MNRQAILSALSLIAYLGSSGCVPWRYTYAYIDAPGARYFKQNCYTTVGAPSVAYYPYHGIFISLDVTGTLALGLHLPAGTTVTLNGNAVRIVGSADSGPIDVTIPLRAARHDSRRNGKPGEFFGMPDPFTSADNLGPLAGDTDDQGRHLWYLFISETTESPAHFIFTPHGLIRGTIELPSISINGQTYNAESLPFERRFHSEISPINC